MRRCSGCTMSMDCRIPEDLDRLERIHKAIGERGGNPWLEARIEQYMAVDVCLADLFGLTRRHGKTEPALMGAPSAVTLFSRPHSVALELALRHHRIDAAATGITAHAV